MRRSYRPATTFPVLLAALSLALGPAPARAETTVLLADGQTLREVQIKAGPAPDQIALDRGEGTPAVVGKDEILVIDFGKTPGRKVVPQVRLLGGDQFSGKISFPGGRQVRVGTAWGTVTVPFAWCAALRLAEKSELPEPGATDAVLLANGDRAEGEILDVKDEKVTLKLAGGTPATLNLARVKALSFARGEPPVEAGGGLQVALDLGGSEQLTARWLGMEGSNLRLKPAWAGELDVPVGSVSRLEVRNGKLVYLTDLRPLEARQVSFLDGDYPYRANLSAAGRPLRLGGKVYPHGIGVHSYSSLKYALDTKFKTFSATLGIDSSVGAHGSVVFRVFGDDRVLFESPILRGGDDPLELTLDVAQVGILRLEVDYADSGDIADHADWANAHLLRP